VHGSVLVVSGVLIRCRIKEQLRLWIVVKGFNSFIYQKYKTPTQKKSKGFVEEASDDEIKTYDRAYWTQRLKALTPSALNVRTIVNSLNLQRYDTSRDSQNVTFDNANLKALEQHISIIADSLPHDEESLIGFGSEPGKLRSETDGLLLRFGHKIWGRDRWQRLPMHEGDEYDSDDLVYAKPKDCDKIRHFLRLWIVVRAVDAFVQRKYEENDYSTAEVSNEEEGASGQFGATSSTFQVPNGLDEEEEVVLDDYEDGIEGIAGVNWTSSTRVRSEQDVGSESSLPVEAVEAPIEAPEIAETVTGRQQSSLLSDVPDDEDSPMAPNDDIQVARTALPDGQADFTKAQIVPTEAAEEPEQSAIAAEIVAAAARTIIAEIVSDIVSASTQSSPPQPPQPPRLADVVAGDGPPHQIAPVTLAAKTKSADIQTTPKRSVRATRNPVPTYNEAILDGRARHIPTKYLEKHHKNVLRGSLADVTQGDSGSSNKLKPETAKTGHANKDLDVTEQWDEGTWRRFTSASVVPVLDFMFSLGLKVHRGGVAEHPACRRLMEDVDQAAAQLYSSSSVDRLVEAAAGYTFLDKTITQLLDEYAKALWAVDIDRSHLLKTGENEMYAKDLNYENEDDRKFLHLHLHQWIFAKAFATYRNTAPSVLANEQDKDDKGIPVEPETANSQAPQRTSRSANQPKPNTQKQKATSKSPLPKQPRAKKTRASDREVHVLAAQALTTAMLAYFKLAEDDSADEADLLNHIEAQTSLYAPVEAYPFPQAMDPWLTYRRAILSVRDRASAPLSSDSSDVRNKIMRARLLTELRIARDEFVAVRNTDGLGCEEYICWAFEKMAEGKDQGSNVRREIEAGFKMLDERLKRLADGLGKGEWVFMG
jgi:hypothetical protein